MQQKQSQEHLSELTVVPVFKYTMEKERVYLWDNLKFLSIICILVLHSTIPYAMDGMTLMHYGQTFINLYPMTMFAIISGFWFKERPIKKMAILFLWPCTLFTIINGILGITSSHFPNYWERFMFKTGYAMWYLFALFLFSVVTTRFVKRFGTITTLIIALFFSMAVGVVPIPNRFLDIQRISRLFPCFVFGVWLRDVICMNSTTLPAINGRIQGGVNISYRMCCVIVLIACVLINLASYYFFPVTRQHDNFTSYYGFNVKAAGCKWFLYFVRIVACTCIIFLVPNKNYWFTKYGSRTMNVYLLHMLIIFPLSWGLLYNYRYEWYGMLFYFFLTPLLCTFFMCKPVDKFMKSILLIKFIK